MRLFDGKTLDGWKQVGGNASYRIEGDYDRRGGRRQAEGNTFLLHGEGRTADFRLELDSSSTSGQLGHPVPQPPDSANGNDRVFGYQCEIDPRPAPGARGIYDEGRRGWLITLKGTTRLRRRSS